MRACLVGRETPVRQFANTGAELDDKLAATHLTLFKGDETIDKGTGVNVLDGPLHALHHFVQELQACPGAPALQPGEVITTGTWTDAWPIVPGETWRAEFEAPFDSLEVTLR
jgi:2-keto-4-pentenoate hydratase